MRITARKSSKITGRERLLNERTRCAPLREVFPNVDQLRIELVFNDASAFIPSPQFHTLYPAASAFFRFACPCADCDGDFDLTGAVAALLENATGRRRIDASSSGRMECQGVRLRDMAGQKGCPMQLSYRLISAAVRTPSVEVVSA
ncbi:MAG: hypothetical protein ABSG30_08760 [Steroidobacteraceae bacterium]|jgi:hypothetical protein